jgi:hypothetical protein
MKALSARTLRTALDLVDRRNELARNGSYPYLTTKGRLTGAPTGGLITTALRSSAAHPNMQVLTTAHRSTTSAARMARTL